MTGNIIDLEEYKAKIEKLKKEAAKEKDKAKRNMMDSIFNWLDIKVEECRKNHEKVKTELDRNPDEPLSEEDKKNIRHVVEIIGRIHHIVEAIKVLHNEGKDWKDYLLMKKK